MATVDLQKLRYFMVVAQTGSVRRAAELLDLSPSALSRTLKQLEEEWGVELFSPSGRGIAITDAGRQLQQRAARVVAEYESFAADVGARKHSDALLRIGSFELFSTHFLGWALHHHFPNRPALIREVIPGEIERALLNLEIDIGITHIPVPRDGVDFLKVATQEMAIFGRREKFQHVPFEQLPFCVPISQISGSAVGVQSLDGWPLDAPARQIRYQVHMLQTALELCSQGDGVLLAPLFIAGLHNQNVRADRRLERLPYPPRMRTVRMEWYLMKRASTVEGPDFKVLARAIRLIAREEA